MTIATIDIGGTGIKFASLTPDGKILDKTSTPTPETLEDLLAWLDQRLSKRDYRGIAMSVPGAVHQETGVIEGISAIPYIHGFSWYETLAHHQLPVHLENDANCVGLSELLAHPEIENAACVVIGTGIGGAMIINGKLHRGRHGLGGEFGYMTTIEPAEKLNNWSQLASTGNMVRYVIEKSGQSDWDGRKVYQEAATGNALCQEAIERMNRNLAQGLLNIQYLIDPDVISLGGSISQNPDFIKGVQKAVDAFVERYEEYTIAPVIQACTYQADANMRALQAQINPHFMYNTLEFIRMYAVMQEQDELGDIIYEFSSLLRNNISDERVTTVENELEFCRKYSYLCMVRYPKSIAYGFKIDPGLEKMKIPKFTIQPLVENYFAHGVDHKRKDNVISVKVLQGEGQVMILVSDNGRGMEEEQLEKIQEILANRNPRSEIEEKSGRQSIGIVNVHERMLLYFGDRYHIHVFSQPHHGVTYTITIQDE